ncbi:PREDICTED: uncharacterized protein LOC109233666 [Nicotiana attenuata]|uniref:uncharacterized protein LOC109233666 n=1 Tax=Nicotiana attenuata TaxID=49451 RepID=UPI0009048A3C|nr:PREDICTED: uncharacterized protein LOC109233666 [Nicotiana attenuata]
MRKVFGNWQRTANYDEAPGGRIWVIWDQTKVEFEVKQVHEQYIAGQVVLRQCNNKFIFVAVYGKHSIHDRKKWIQKWPNMEGTIMQPGFSDHCPLMVTVAEPTGMGKRPFKFFNCLATHPKFDDIVSQCWMKRSRGNLMLKVWYKLKNLKKDLKQLNNEEYSSVGPKIQAARNKLMNIQIGMAYPKNDDEVIALETETKVELAKWLELEESIIKQARNHIGRLMDNTRQLLQNANEVEEEILSFYKKLLGTAASTLPIVDPNVMQNGHTLTRQQQMQLIKPITKEEVHKALQGIDDSKVPGCDGYNSHFFKKTWNILGEEVTKAVLEFFETTEMCKAINCTTITLIPKVKNPTNIKEFRPISCCTVLYKMISKILTARLQEIMPDLIDNCQQLLYQEG